MERMTQSLPPRGAWIEIAPTPSRPARPRSLPPRGAWIEIPVGEDVGIEARSLPPRGAWIEITQLSTFKKK